LAKKISLIVAAFAVFMVAGWMGAYVLVHHGHRVETGTGTGTIVGTSTR
jgi:hypothetical protein